MAAERPFFFVDTSEQLTGMLDSLAGAARLALDTESDPFHRYFEKVCLIQLSTEREDVIVDPLQVGFPAELRALLTDPGRAFVLHGADYDVRMLRRSFDVTLGVLFDTSLAARLLGSVELSLRGLLEQELGVSIGKAEQRSDWGRRPLTAAQLAYARADTAHLLPLADRLQDRLEARGRTAWLVEECARLRSAEPAVKSFDPDGWRKLPGAHSLAPPAQQVLAGLFRWREDQARALDRPPFRVLQPDLLVRLAVESSTDPKGLKSTSFVPKTVDRAELCRVVESALSATGEGAMGETEGKGRMSWRPEPEARKRLERLKAARALWARELELDPGFLISTAVLERLAQSPPRDMEALRGVRGMTEWRIMALGPAILAELLL